VDEARGGMFTNLGTSCLAAVCSAAAAGTDCEVEDGAAGVEGAMEALASRLEAELGRE
jgi:hypothetical protein